MKNLILLFVASIVFASCASVSGNGNVRDENRTIPAVQAVKTSGSIDVEIKEGNDFFHISLFGV